MIRLRPSKAHQLLKTLAKKLPNCQPIFNTIKLATILNADHGDIYTKEKTSSLVASVDRHPATDVQYLNIFWDPQEHCDQEVHDFLRQIPTLKWGDPIYLLNVNSTLSENMENILSSADLIGGRLQKIRREVDLVDFKPKKSPFAKAFEGLPDDLLIHKPLPEVNKIKIKTTIDEFVKARLPDGFEISHLRREDLKDAMGMWYQREIDPEKFERRFRGLPSHAIYTTQDSKLANFSFFCRLGMGGGNYTLPEFREFGFSTLTLGLFVLDVPLYGLVPVASAIKSNKISLDTMQSFGLIKISDVFQEIYYLEKDKDDVVLPFLAV